MRQEPRVNSYTKTPVTPPKPTTPTHKPATQSCMPETQPNVFALNASFNRYDHIVNVCQEATGPRCLEVVGICLIIARLFRQNWFHGNKLLDQIGRLLPPYFDKWVLVAVYLKTFNWLRPKTAGPKSFQEFVAQRLCWTYPPERGFEATKQDTLHLTWRDWPCHLLLSEKILVPRHWSWELDIPSLSNTLAFW